jgi:hypothetical protein
MKKTIIFIIACMVADMSFAQQVIYNGEDVNPGWWVAAPYDRGIDNDWDNPAKTAVNASDKCVSMWINNDEPDWVSGGLGGLDIDVSAYNRISVVVYKLVAGPVRLELQDGVNPNVFISQDYTTPGEWQKLVFEIPAALGNIVTLLVAPHFENHEENPIADGEAHRFFWDEVKAYYETETAISSVVVSAEIISTKIYSVTGALITSFDKNKTNLKNLPHGIYILQQTDAVGNKTSRKIGY